MKKSFAAIALLAMLAAPAYAAPPADQDACNGLAFSLAEKAASKKLAEPAATKVDELISKLEGQCADGKFTEADATAKEVETALK